MLKTLTVWNFALLEHVQVEFGPGLNILTGETGAGKSILIDSLGAILGHRISADSIRTGCDWLRVEAVFTLDDVSENLHALLTNQAIDDNEGLLIITRQVTRGGRSIVLVNGRHVTLTLLKQIGAFLVDIHGQNENLALLKEENQFSLLDQYDQTIQDSLHAYHAAYTGWQEKKRLLEQNVQNAREYAQRLDMLRWQDQEISAAHLQEQEDEQLETAIQKLSHAEKLTGFVEESYDLLENGTQKGIGVLAALSQVSKNLEAMSRFDDSMSNMQEMVEEASITLQEVASDLRQYGESIEFRPDKLDTLQKRMDVIYRLRKKYGATISDILAHQKKVQQELHAIAHYDEDIAELEQDISAREKQMKQCAAVLSDQRIKAAKALSALIQNQLASLGMPDAVFRIDVQPSGKYMANGTDNVALLFSANRGETAKPLQKVASGGELSRIALAVKTVAASRDTSVPSMVFDEIDTGIGGRTAQMVAERIAQVAFYKQVLCITHLPQIACMADIHLYLSKVSEENSVVTHVRTLSECERISEIARMASGADITSASLDNAREMVSHARTKKQQFAQKKQNNL